MHIALLHFGGQVCLVYPLHLDNGFASLFTFLLLQDLNLLRLIKRHGVGLVADADALVLCVGFHELRDIVLLLRLGLNYHFSLVVELWCEALDHGAWAEGLAERAHVIELDLACVNGLQVHANLLGLCLFHTSRRDGVLLETFLVHLVLKGSPAILVLFWQLCKGGFLKGLFFHERRLWRIIALIW